MGFREGRAPPGFARRTDQSIADLRATWLAGIAVCFSLAADVGFPGNGVFMGAAPAIALGFGFVGLTGIWMERFRGGFARLLLLCGAVALLAVGLGYVGRAEAARIVLAYFVPAFLFALAAWMLGGVSGPCRRSPSSRQP